MNKQTKGAIAAGAAALLLAGGAGTMAAWNSSQTVAGGAVNSGTLSLTQNGSPAGWKENGNPVDITTFKAVPGDVITYNASFKVGAVGKNLNATLTADTSTITGDAALISALAPSTVVTKNGAPLAGGAITESNNNDIVDVAVTFTFNNATAGTTAQGAAVNLANFNVKLQQNS
ncbi:alternate-type signal peptide domain-containing protein [Rhodococcus maanshanensis]|uniref:Alternate signal-mediated exported protein, RER_14450 family n=1 Tax=Rhodococcus maanshanensis TaxID=183556 RepID=A0A1H7TBG5_9NOCA|nr:alternate-type signal peptide domain-containing protein [Rhodococcus maanshanensis]SEL81849.1 alternate signal-mediated exported protein, RER_14450 family [Rhodococcus maanshanensis]